MREWVSTQRTALFAVMLTTMFGIVGSGGAAGALRNVASHTAASTTLVTAWPSDITSLDPANLSTNQDHELSRNIYQTLLEVKFAAQMNGSLQFVGAHVVPGLASSWT